MAVKIDGRRCFMAGFESSLLLHFPVLILLSTPKWVAASMLFCMDRAYTMLFQASWEIQIGDDSIDTGKWGREMLGLGGE
jgi:hypothetical protein